jgi:hypothetical protein
MTPIAYLLRSVDVRCPYPLLRMRQTLPRLAGVVRRFAFLSNQAEKPSQLENQHQNIVPITSLSFRQVVRACCFESGSDWR